MSSTSTRGGIQGLVDKAEKSVSQTNQQLGEAFQDIQTLMDRAAPMVQLASSIAAKVQKINSSSVGEDSDNALIRNYLVQLGIDSPVTKDVAGSLFHQELAKEIGKIIVPLLSQPPYLGAIDLVDVYCIFNRARGVGNLVSPEDILKSCDCFDKLCIPLLLKKFPSGVNVLQAKGFAEDMVISRIMSELKAQSDGLDVTGLSNRLGNGISLEMLNGYLQSAEEKGLICRDSAPPLGILFYFPATPFFP
ncbi:Vacuolar protein-sorting-associated protein 36 [Entomophthora muscae]|uniref:Vacuolar protein-sorting-associated protein 36 n=1 Tax=Entomophthora muscae TaxID=34485 RepID=A0ACC2UV67_9FUNG|nr:Vacuolar protein-sorting-associated protein 36 [Entomophthora muscae]